MVALSNKRLRTIKKAHSGNFDRYSKTTRRAAFLTEMDRLYVDTPADCVIEDKELKRAIRIAKTGSRSTVVWNP